MRRTSQRIVIASVVLLVLLDLLMLSMGGVDATFSRVIYDASKREPIIPFAAGVLCGHLFWPQKLK